MILCPLCVCVCVCVWSKHIAVRETAQKKTVLLHKSNLCWLQKGQAKYQLV